MGDYVYLKVSPTKGVQRFGVKRKLAPRYVGPYKIIERKGNVAYKLQLPPEMSAIFDVFHVSQLKRCLRIPEEAIAPTNIKIQSDLTYEEKPIRVLEEMERVTWSKVIKFYKVVWNNHGRIIYMRFIPPFMRNGRSFKSRDEIPTRGRGCNTLVLSIAFDIYIS